MAHLLLEVELQQLCRAAALLAVFFEAQQRVEQLLSKRTQSRPSDVNPMSIRGQSEGDTTAVRR